MDWFLYYLYGDPRVLHGLTRSCPSRPASDLLYWLLFYFALVLAATPLAARLRRSHGVQHHIATAAAVLALLLVGAHSLRTVHLTGENRHGRGYAEMAWRYSPTVAAVDRKSTRLHSSH